MKTDIKIIFIDIDWTILNHGHDKHEFDMPSIEALKQVQKKDILIYLCTARPYDSIIQTGLLDMIKPDGIICTNGAVVFINNQLIHHNVFNPEDVKKIIQVAHKHHLTIELSSDKERWLTKKGNKYVDNYFAVFNEIYPPIRKYNNENISAVLLFAPKKFDDILNKELPKGISCFRFSDYGIDVHHTPIYKSEGIIEVLKYLKIDPCYSMGIGDDYGDIEMFKVVGYPVCMENGREEAKKYAKYICPHIDDHGVKIALQKYFK